MTNCVNAVQSDIGNQAAQLCDCIAGCVNCGNDDGPYRVCLDCLEKIGD